MKGKSYRRRTRKFKEVNGFFFFASTADDSFKVNLSLDMTNFPSLGDVKIRHFQYTRYRVLSIRSKYERRSMVLSLTRDRQRERLVVTGIKILLPHSFFTFSFIVIRIIHCTFSRLMYHH